jgi:hypothetical protein
MIGKEPIGRRQVLSWATGMCAATTALFAQQRQRKPNVVLILADDLGYGDLSAWGGRDLRTPNIDALAASGVRFDRFYANSPVCSPTRAALLTGCYPDTVGVPGVIRTAPASSWGYLAATRSCCRRDCATRAIIRHWWASGTWAEAPICRNRAL